MNTHFRPAPDRLTPGGGDLISRTHDIAVVLSEAVVEADASARIADRTLQALHRSGLPMAPFSAAMGGDDLLAPEACETLAKVLRLVGAADLSIGRLLEGHVNAVALVSRYGTQAQLVELSRFVGNGGLTGVWAAEDATGLRIDRSGQRDRLDGCKVMASGAGLVRRPIVTAVSDGGTTMLMLDLDDDSRIDLSGWTAQGMRSTATGRVDLTGSTLAADQIVGAPGDFMRQPHFSGGAWRFCAVHLGAVERLVDLLREHLVARGRAGDPYQRQRVAHCAVATTTANFWVSDAARRVTQEIGDAADVVAFVNMTRMVTERAALDVLEAVHRGVGLQSFLRPHPLERITRDLSTYLRQPVPDLAMADAGRAVLESARPIGDFWSAE